MVQRGSAVGLLFFCVFASKSAHADCADGWFCDDTNAPPASTTPPPVEPEPAPAAPSAAATAPHAPPAPPPAAEPGTPNEFGVTPPPKAGTQRRARTEFGVNLHLAGAFLWSDEAAAGAGMGAVGAAFRVRPSRALGLDFGFDLAGGEDWNGNERYEQALVASALFFVNPGDPVEAYLLGGLALTGASVRVERRADRPAGPYETTYSYFGLHAGVGLEWRVSPRLGLALDVIGVGRTRTDENQEYDPEFVDPVTHRVTNTSAFGLARLGGTFYF
jgi:hypothetical protein